MADQTEAVIVNAPKSLAHAEVDPLAAERALGRNIAIGLPALTIGGSIVAGVTMSIGPAILVLAAGAIVGAIALFWTSLRTLAGDAALPEDLELLAARPFAHAPADTRKQLLLRALKDLEHDHAVGKIDREDYEDLAARYREEAKAAMREMDESSEPLRRKAEEIARVYLDKRGLGANGAMAAKTAFVEAAVPKLHEGDSPSSATVVAASSVMLARDMLKDEHGRGLDDEDNDDSDEDEKPEVSDVTAARRICPSCATSNEIDAAFCKKCGTVIAVPKIDPPTE